MISDNNRAKTTMAELHLDQNDIIHITFRKPCLITTSEVKAIFIERMKLSKTSQNQLILVTHGANIQTTRESRVFSQSKEFVDATEALAIVIKSELSKVTANFFLYLLKQYYPTKVFTTAEEAIIWLKTFKK